MPKKTQANKNSFMIRKVLKIISIFKSPGEVGRCMKIVVNEKLNIYRFERKTCLLLQLIFNRLTAYLAL